MGRGKCGLLTGPYTDSSNDTAAFFLSIGTDLVAVVVGCESCAGGCELILLEEDVNVVDPSRGKPRVVVACFLRNTDLLITIKGTKQDDDVRAKVAVVVEIQ
jgi:hypothetical protein